MNIAIVDYGMGNIHSITGALTFLGVKDPCLTHTPEKLAQADRLLLPGVGNFATAMKRINMLGLGDVLTELVLVQRKPILGICLGMQLLGKGSTESGVNEGLGLIEGDVTEFSREGLKVPHVGYNQVAANINTRLYKDINENADFYFTHSFKMLSEIDIGQSYCDYGSPFIASFERDNIAGVQFHPELSQHNGLKLLKNFIELF
ncbi:MAG: imidazole glycerol phosphate synthase subunit HisH [Aestuariibacter sp.]